MTPLMLSLVLWRAAHTSNVPYCHFSAAAVRGSLLKLVMYGLVTVTDIMACDYYLTERGHKHVGWLLEQEFPA
jgi:hypothetical protein